MEIGFDKQLPIKTMGRFKQRLRICAAQYLKTLNYSGSNQPIAIDSEIAKKKEKSGRRIYFG